MGKKGDVGVGGEMKTIDEAAKSSGMAFWGFDHIRRMALIGVTNGGQSDMERGDRCGAFGCSEQRTNKIGCSSSGKIARWKTHEERETNDVDLMVGPVMRIEKNVIFSDV